MKENYRGNNCCKGQACGMDYGSVKIVGSRENTCFTLYSLFIYVHTIVFSANNHIYSTILLLNNFTKSYTHRNYLYFPVYSSSTYSCVVIYSCIVTKIEKISFIVAVPEKRLAEGRRQIYKFFYFISKKFNPTQNHFS